MKENNVESKLIKIDKKIKLYEDKGYCLIVKQKEDNVSDTAINNNSNNKKLVEDEDAFTQDEIEKIRVGVNTKDTFDEFLKAENDDEEYDFCIFQDKEKVEIKIIKNLSTFVEEITNNEQNGKEHIYYRAHSNTDYKLEPSLYRDEKTLNNEANLYNEFLTSYPHFFADCSTTLERMVKMQHHKVPTRLLDLTENPLIALYFTCIGNKDKNGEVLSFTILKEKFKYFDSDTVSVLSNLVKCDNKFGVSDFEFPEKIDEIENEEYLELINEFNELKSVKKLVHFIKDDRSYFGGRIDPKHLNDYTVVVKPKMSIERIINQSGAFVLFGINKKKEFMSKFDINSDEKQKIFVIPAKYKEKMLVDLKRFNINKSTVYCDMDSVAEYLKNEYCGK